MFQAVKAQDINDGVREKLSFSKRGFRYHQSLTLIKQMTQNQFHLFSQQSENLAEGYGKLSVFAFEAAEKIFNEIISSYLSAEEEVYDGLQLAAYWKDVLQLFESSPAETSVPFFYNEIVRCYFKPTWGMQLFHSALVNHLIDRMRRADMFYINDEVCLSDLLLEEKRYQSAEKELSIQLQKESNHLLRYRLAQVQWREGNQKEANKNYILALLHHPVNAPISKIENENLKDLVITHGSGMASAYGWISGELPLVRISDPITPCNENHRKAITCYQLLLMAEKAVRNDEMEACVHYRKQLKEQAPKLYDAYYELLSRRR